MVTITDIQNENNVSVIFTFENPTQEEKKIINDLKKKFIDRKAEEEYWTIGKPKGDAAKKKEEEEIGEQMSLFKSVDLMPVPELDEIPFLTEDMKQEIIAEREKRDKEKAEKSADKSEKKSDIVW